MKNRIKKERQSEEREGGPGEELQALAGVEGAGLWGRAEVQGLQGP